MQEAAAAGTHAANCELRAAKLRVKAALRSPLAMLGACSERRRRRRVGVGTPSVHAPLLHPSAQHRSAGCVAVWRPPSETGCPLPHLGVFLRLALEVGKHPPVPDDDDDAAWSTAPSQAERRRCQAAAACRRPSTWRDLTTPRTALWPDAATGGPRGERCAAPLPWRPPCRRMRGHRKHHMPTPVQMRTAGYIKSGCGPGDATPLRQPPPRGCRLHAPPAAACAATHPPPPCTCQWTCVGRGRGRGGAASHQPERVSQSTGGTQQHAGMRQPVRRSSGHGRSAAPAQPRM